MSKSDHGTIGGSTQVVPSTSSRDAGFTLDPVGEVVVRVERLQYHRIGDKTSENYDQSDLKLNALRILLTNGKRPIRSILITTDREVNKDGTIDTSDSSQRRISRRSQAISRVILDGRDLPTSSVLHMLGVRGRGGRDEADLKPGNSAHDALPASSATHHCLKGRVSAYDRPARRHRVNFTTRPSSTAERGVPEYTTPGHDAAILSLSYQPVGSSTETYVEACTAGDFRSLNDEEKSVWAGSHWISTLRAEAPPAEDSNAGGEEALPSRSLSRRFLNLFGGSSEARLVDA